MSKELCKESRKFIEKVAYKYAMEVSDYATLWDFLIGTKYKKYISHYLVCVFNDNSESGYQEGYKALKQTYYEIFMGDLSPKYIEESIQRLIEAFPNERKLQSIQDKAIEVAEHLGYAADDPEKHKEIPLCKKLDCISLKKKWSLIASHMGFA